MDVNYFLIIGHLILIGSFEINSDKVPTKCRLTCIYLFPQVETMCYSVCTTQDVIKP